MIPAPEPPDPDCAACSKPILSGRLCLVQHGELYHHRCMSRTLELKVAEEQERAVEAKTRAAEAMDRAARLIEEAKRRRAQWRDGKRTP